MSNSLLATYLKDSESWESYKVPKYIRLSNVILRLIEEGHWKPGGQLPAEAEMARTVDASLGTIQKALSTLVERGVVVREHGRGTFITGGRAPEQDVWHFRFLDDDGDTLLPIYSRVVEIVREKKLGPWIDFLGKEKAYVKILRFMSVNHEFDILSEFYVSENRFGAILDMPVKSFHGAIIRNILGEKFGVPTLRIVQNIRCDRFPAEVCTRLERPKNLNGLIWEMLGYTRQNAPLSYQRAYVPPNNRSLQISEIPVPRYLSLANSGMGGFTPNDESRKAPARRSHRS